MASMIAAEPNNYASSKAGSTTTDSVARGRTWSADITKNWNLPSSQSESMQERLERYSVYFTLDKEQLRHIMNRFLAEIDVALNLKRANPNVQWTAEQCSLRLLDTCVDTVPTGQEKATTFAIDLGGTNIRVIRAKLEGNGKVSMKAIKKELRQCGEHKKGLLDRDATASEFFDAFAGPLRDLMSDKEAAPKAGMWSPVGFTFSFPIIQRTLKSARLVSWTKEFETGRNTADVVEGNDVCALLDQALWRNEVTAKTAAVMNDTTGTLLSCAYERPPKMPMCLIGLILGTGVNGCYYQEDAQQFGYQGKILNTECGGFDKGLPFTDVDLEVDFANLATRGTQVFEKMTSGMYLGEVCRRLILKVYQKRAPDLAWVRESMPSEAASMILNDASSSLKETEKVLDGLWEWETKEAERENIKRMVTLVFDRSAALAAAVICGMAHKTKKLQPALGGLTVGIDGSLYTCNKWYAQRVRSHVDEILGSELGKLIHLCEANDGSGKGAAILAAVVPQKK